MQKVGIISTSANPLHAGHLQIAKWGDDNGYKVIFDISRNNADKGLVDDLEINRRNAQVINAGYDVINLTEPMFVYKSSELKRLYASGRFPYSPEQVWFFVGFDTILRVDSNQYYDSSYISNEAMKEKMIKYRDVKFVVFERNGQSDLSVLSPILRSRCELATNYTSVDISSTQLREHGRKAHGY